MQGIYQKLKIKILSRLLFHANRETKDEQLFDWYADGQEVFLQILQNKRISATKRVKPL